MVPDTSAHTSESQSVTSSTPVTPRVASSGGVKRRRSINLEVARKAALFLCARDAAWNTLPGSVFCPRINGKASLEPLSPVTVSTAAATLGFGVGVGVGEQPRLDRSLTWGEIERIVSPSSALDLALII